MKLPYYTRKDWLIIGSLLPPVVIIVNYWLFGNRYFKEQPIFIWATLISAVTGVVSWQLQIIVAIRLQLKYPRYSQTLKRLFFAITTYITTTALSLWLLFWLYDYLPFFHYTMDYLHFTWSLIACILIVVLAASFHEGVAFYEKWKKVTDEAEQLKKANLQTQLESLKSQVNPHFLFNSLNSLSALIQEDTGKADRFLNELCKVYRYLLRNIDEDLTSLHAEIAFLQSYGHLLETRYGKSLELQIQVPESYHDLLIPPLTLQILVENAVKHNRMLKDKPLRIVLYIENEKLVVANNLQQKVREVSSNRIGLSSILRKYELLSKEQIEILVTEDRFSVLLPLIREDQQSLAGVRFVPVC